MLHQPFNIFTYNEHFHLVVRLLVSKIINNFYCFLSLLLCYIIVWYAVHVNLIKIFQDNMSQKTKIVLRVKDDHHKKQDIQSEK